MRATKWTIIEGIREINAAARKTHEETEAIRQEMVAQALKLLDTVESLERKQ